jgi:hypothetical protein
VVRIRSLAAVASAILVIATGPVIATATSASAATSPHVGSSVFTAQFDAQPPTGEPWAFLRIFPAVLSVHQGDVIDAAFGGTDTPHTATVVPAANADKWRQQNQGQGEAYAPIGPDQQFGGDDNEFDINPSLVFPSDFTCGTSDNPCSFDASGVVNSGLTFPNPGGAEPHFFVQVNAAVGHYSLLCMLHAGMQIPLNVRPDTTPIKSPERVEVLVRKQIQHAIRVDGAAADAQAQEVTTSSSHGHTLWTIHAGGFSNNVTANEYVGSGLTIHKRDSIQVVGNEEIHTATFPWEIYKKLPLTVTECEVPGPDTPAQSPFDCTDPSLFRVAFVNQAILPTQDNALLGEDHFVNSGLLTSPSDSYTFIAKRPGTYKFICLVHGPEMTATITVQP